MAKGLSGGARGLGGQRSKGLEAPLVSAICDDASLDMTLVASGKSLIAEHGLMGAFEVGLSKLRFAGLGEEELRESMHGYPRASHLIGPEISRPAVLRFGELCTKRRGRVPAIGVL